MNRDYSSTEAAFYEFVPPHGYGYWRWHYWNPLPWPARRV